MPLIAFLPSLPLRLSYPLLPIRSARRAVHLAIAPSPTPHAAPNPSTFPRTLTTTSNPFISDDASATPAKPATSAISLPLQSPFSDLWPRFLLLFVAVIWGTNFPIVKLLHTPPDPLSVSTAALARFTLAAVAMLPFIPAELKASRRTSFPMPFLVSTFFIGTSIAAGYFAQSVSLITTDASTSAFLCSLAVVVVPILTRFANTMGWIRDVDNRAIIAKWGAPLLAVLGIAMLEFGGTPPSIGDAWAFVQAFGFALGFILNDRLTANYPDLVFSQSAIQLNVVSALALVWAVVDSSATAGTFAFPHISDAFTHGTNALAVMYTGFITTALTVWIENIALKKVSAGELAVLLSTEPFWAAALAAIVLGETMGPWAVAGGGVILLACIINQAGGKDVADILPSRDSQQKTTRDLETGKEALVAMLNKELHR